MIREGSYCTENDARYSHEGSPGRTSAFLGAQRVLVHDAVDGKHENRPCEISTGGSRPGIRDTMHRGVSKKSRNKLR